MASSGKRHAPASPTAMCIICLKCPSPKASNDIGSDAAHWFQPVIMSMVRCVYVHRYPVYIDAGAYSSSLKQKLVAGSPMLTIKHRCVSLLRPDTCSCITACRPVLVS